MPSPEDHLAVIAESYKGIQESTHVIAHATARMEATQQLLAQTQRTLVRHQGFALVLIGFSLLFTGYVVWQHFAQGHEHAALIQALTTQMHALVEQMQQTPAH